MRPLKILFLFLIVGLWSTALCMYSMPSGIVNASALDADDDGGDDDGGDDDGGDDDGGDDDGGDDDGGDDDGGDDDGGDDDGGDDDGGDDDGGDDDGDDDGEDDDDDEDPNKQYWDKVDKINWQKDKDPDDVIRMARGKSQAIVWWFPPVGETDDPPKIAQKPIADASKTVAMFFKDMSTTDSQTPLMKEMNVEKRPCMILSDGHGNEILRYPKFTWDNKVAGYCKEMKTYMAQKEKLIAKAYNDANEYYTKQTEKKKDVDLKDFFKKLGDANGIKGYEQCAQISALVKKVTDIHMKKINAAKTLYDMGELDQAEKELLPLKKEYKDIPALYSEVVKLLEQIAKDRKNSR